MVRQVNMLCMTTKQHFVAENPPVKVLSNGRFAVCVECPWKGRNGRTLHAWKFCSESDHRAYLAELSTEPEVTKLDEIDESVEEEAEIA